MRLKAPHDPPVVRATGPARVPMNPAPLTIDVVSDVVCPWCYIGKRKLEAALAMPQAGAFGPVELRWHPFQLNPDLPQEGVSRKDYLEAKFGGPQRAAQIYEHVRAAGRSAGLELDIEGIQRQPNTRLAHVLIAHAQQLGLGSEIKERLLKAYFVQGRFIGDHAVLLEIAREGGLDADAARAALDDAQALAAVDAADAQARRLGIQGVPFFVFNQRLAVSGAQDPAVLLDAMQQSLAQA